MNEQNKTSRVKLCAICEDYDNTCGHDLAYNGFRCNLCLYVHSLLSEANSCCMDMVSKAVVGSELRQKESKRKPKDFDKVPFESLRGRRDD